MNVYQDYDWLQTYLLVRWVMTRKSRILSPGAKVYRWVYLELPAYQIPSFGSQQPTGFNCLDVNIELDLVSNNP